MSDVARLAGVGTMTVSRVLSGAAAVSEQSAQRVRVAVEQLNYRPNELARVFRGQRSKSIGLILPYLHDPFFATCAHAVATEAQARGYSVFTALSEENPDKEFAEVEQMLQRNLAGLLAIPARYRQSRLTRSLFGKMPAVVFDRPVSDSSVDSVLVQNSAGSRRIVEHLIEHGHKRIGFMGLSRNLFTMNTRFLGYRRALQDASLKEDSYFGCETQEDTLCAIQEKLKGSDPPTALFAASSLITRFVFASLLQLGVKVPTEVALVGFGDFEMAELTSPPLTVVRQPAAELGRVAANLLFERIAQDDAQRNGNRIVLPVEIVLRRSCGCKHRSPVVLP
jgi:LacI family transcriptional regulator